MSYYRNDPFLKALGNRIRQLRKERNLTQAQLANKCDNHAEYIGRIERGQYNVSSSSLYKIALALDITMKELFDFEINEK